MLKKIDWRLVAIFGGYAVLTAGYGLIQIISDPVLIVHSVVDDWIPFCEWFVIPYVIWYPFVFLPAMLFLIKERESLFKMGSFIVAGLVVCVTFFIVCPNGIDFRPDPADFENKNFLTWLVGWLYAHDQPENVCPSLHVLDSLIVWAAIHHSPMLRKWRIWLSPLTGLVAILICLSTAFIKQHSVIDIVVAAGLFLLIYPFIYCRKRKTDEVSA